MAGTAALAADTLGHFLGIGPFAQNRDSPYTIGGFEAHGLAVILAFLLRRSASLSERRHWHSVALVVHGFLGLSNIVFWSSFVHMDVVRMGVVATVLHAVFVIVHGVCLRSLAAHPGPSESSGAP